MGSNPLSSRCLASAPAGTLDLYATPLLFLVHWSFGWLGGVHEDSWQSVYMVEHSPSLFVTLLIYIVSSLLSLSTFVISVLNALVFWGIQIVILLFNASSMYGKRTSIFLFCSTSTLSFHQ